MEIRIGLAFIIYMGMNGHLNPISFTAFLILVPDESTKPLNITV